MGTGLTWKWEQDQQTNGNRTSRKRGTGPAGKWELDQQAKGNGTSKDSVLPRYLKGCRSNMPSFVKINTIRRKKTCMYS